MPCHTCLWGYKYKLLMHYSEGVKYRIVENFGGGKLWQMGKKWTGEKNFGVKMMSNNTVYLNDVKYTILWHHIL